MIIRAKTFGLLGTDLPATRHLHRHSPLAHATALAGIGSLNRCLDKIVLNHRRNGDGKSENLLDGIMRAIENNGQVTLPETRMHGNGWKITVSIAVGLAGLGALALALFR